MRTFRSPFRSSIVAMQPFTFTVPVPVATSAPLQQYRYLPVPTSARTTLPGFDSSCRHKLKTFTPNVHAVVFPDTSLAVHVTEVVPTGNIEPEGGLHTTVTPGQLSVAAGVVKVPGVPTANGHEGWAVSAISPGHPFTKTGAGASIIFTVKLHVPVLLEASFAEQLTLAVPIAKSEPEAGTQVTAIWLEGVQLSVADGVW